MPKITDIEDKGKKGLDISGLPWMKRAIGPDFAKGGKMISKSIMYRSAVISFLLLTLNLLFSSQTYGEEKITGAFGMKLGNYFDPSSAIGSTELTDGTPMYRFSPKKEFRSFDRYYVMITPKTHKIYGIWGIGKAENTEKCKKEQAIIMELLQKKYGFQEKEGLFDSLWDMKEIDQGNRYIIVKYSGFMDVTIDIRYYDRDLEKLAEKERIELEASKVDSSGL